ncbi:MULTISPECIES: transferrin-binding protein-like solute binding protein [unclassified Neisseria]|uniref:transferrin-binding protein-like solute binding protein n=1 Tax=unclassified Neisseria TaxID=2623750 RepID=UPI002666D771|nr:MULTISPECIES: transferrin-binding protein-like solute binding protein [unclassified Neisseria]MDO1516962.1 transferrin-binding protein-like solute binding protein [Neisseria sp. MVDL18-041461]MDO1564324.1 transferrin-binding protein-like solute binding protein [Neisseria sp. MVDL20-010259]
MYFAKKIGVLICIPFIISACATNKGDFGLNDVNILPPGKRKPEINDEKTPPRTDEQVSAFMEPSLGVSVEIPRRSTGVAGSVLEERVELTPEKIKNIGGNLEIPHIDEIKKHPQHSGSIAHSHDGFIGDHRKRDMEYVRSGWVVDDAVGLEIINGPSKKILSGTVGYVYYKGINPSQSFPTSGKATYKGTWDFTTDARQGRKKESFNGSAPGIGNNYGATSFDEADTINTDKSLGEVGHSSELEVDFAKKSLTGKLYKNHRVIAGQTQKRTLRYNVEASIKGNRFQGRVLANDKKDTYFGKDGSLEGGFFGPAAEELAGKFLADDNSLFGVLAGKRSKEKNEKTEKIIDAFHIGLGTLQPSEADNFGDARKFVFKGQTFSLLPTTGAGKSFLETLKYDLGNNRTLSLVSCCSNLDYLKFGTYQVTEGDKKGDAGFFFQGERTPVSEVPTSGTAQYKGSWQAQIISKSGHTWSESPNNNSGGSRAVFNVDFGQKKINGTLTADNRVSPTFTIDADISGNGFSGRAKTGENGFVLDPGSTGRETRVHLDAEVKGGFYGPKASELGGIFHSNKAGEDRVGGSFGGKRQAPGQ